MNSLATALSYNRVTDIDREEYNLDYIKNSIEKLSKFHQIKILKILKKNPTVKLNENKSGVYVNLSFLPQDTILEMREYMNYIRDQECSLNDLESQKEDFKNTFFVEKENKDETILYSSSLGYNK